MGDLLEVGLKEKYGYDIYESILFVNIFVFRKYIGYLYLVLNFRFNEVFSKKFG